MSLYYAYGSLSMGTLVLLHRIYNNVYLEQTTHIFSYACVSVRVLVRRRTTGAIFTELSSFNCPFQTVVVSPCFHPVVEYDLHVDKNDIFTQN